MGISDLTEEQRQTISCLAENNMNVAATARAMNYHRNTVVYHIERIKELTGLDPAKFHDLARLEAELNTPSKLECMELADSLKKPCWGRDASAVDRERALAASTITSILAMCALLDKDRENANEQEKQRGEKDHGEDREIAD